MQKMRNMPPTQKFIACLFVISFVAAVFFIAVRVIQKPAYEAHEKRQCGLLAASTLTLFAQKTELLPELWDAFAEDKVVLILDHRAMPGNWNVRLTATRLQADGTIILRAETASGWNSRSPGSAVRYALLSGIRESGERLRISFDENSDFTPSLSPSPEDKALPFIYPGGKEPPVKIEALITSFRCPDDNESYVILTLKR